jgi:hypothetical protein
MFSGQYADKSPTSASDEMFNAFILIDARAIKNHKRETAASECQGRGVKAINKWLRD